MKQYRAQDWLGETENINVQKNCVQNSESPHTHDFIELVYIYAGAGQHCIGGKNYGVSKGNLLFINYNQTQMCIRDRHMTVELKEYIENLSKVTADKERIATELSVATQIQTSMLPCIFPAFPEREDFDVYASMLAAKEVGGDFYDFFLIDDTHLGVVIADVSGKGVPAALFMVIAKTLIKNHAQMGKPAGTVFETVNNQLCENNEAGLDVYKRQLYAPPFACSRG